eukprot:CAMPEP_0172301870 /NCGR_PEP_ID=MMETSP1058-20130122/3683_1 /TAXON_ID=83371 /ORGANISM="Detonula confervacea, Strain CCMP 353" /LENGTH=659 /DNA_ID=CAMNT_0013012163 /DNA_START=117 /DNA_END=2096 /DNA_ORIENTATION=+
MENAIGNVLVGDTAERGGRADAAGEGVSEDERGEAVDSDCDESDDDDFNGEVTSDHEHDGDVSERGDDCADEANGNDGEESDDDEEEDYEDSDSEWFEFDEETLLQMKRNDPNVTSAEVRFDDVDDYNAFDVDWEREGDCIGKNTHLKSLIMAMMGTHYNMDDEDRRANVVAFYRAVARNRSIRHISMRHGHIGDMFEILSPFFGHNHNLRGVDIWGSDLDERSTRLLVSALSRCKTTSLRTIKLCSTQIDNEGAAKIVNALAVHNNLKEVTLCFRNTVGDWCTALAQLLLNPMSKIEDLILGYNHLMDEGAIALGNALANNSTLKKLSLNGNVSVTSTGWVAFSSCLANHNSSLEVLNLRGNNIGDDGVTAFANALVNNTKLTDLDLSHTQGSVSSVGWRTFFNLLRNPNSALENLHLSANNIIDGSVALVVDALGSISSLKYLDLRSNHSIIASGWMTLSNLLRHPNCILEELHLEDNDDSINDEVVIAFANSLANNISLKALCLGDYSGIIGDNTNITPRGWSALANTLCNKSSIDSIYASNHTLQTGSFSESDLLIDLPSDFVSSLQLNQNNNKFEVAREKILQHHFCNGDINIQELLEIELQVMCHAIAWIGRDGTGFPLLYHLVRSMPALFDFDSQGKANGTGAKRQRICEKG